MSNKVAAFPLGTDRQPGGGAFAQATPRMSMSSTHILAETGWLATTGTAVPMSEAPLITKGVE